MNNQQFLDFQSLYNAFQKCKNGVMWKDSVGNYNANILKNTFLLCQDLKNNSYQLKPYTQFIVTDPKRREVLATNIRDRQFQRSLCDNYLYKDLTEHFIYDNAACQVGKGVDFALNRMEQHLRNYYMKHSGNGYVLKCDIYHYFAETSHNVAKAAVRKRVKNDDVYQYVCQIIDSFGGNKGIGLGSQVSQLIQLAVLDDLDHFIKERLKIKYYMRYMDDFILIHESKEHLNRCLKEIESILYNLGLKLNGKTQLFPIKQGIKWLQWTFYLTDSGKVIRIPAKKSFVREKRKIRNMFKKGLPVECAAESFRSWAATIERGKTSKNNKRRKTNKPVRGIQGKMVEKMRKYFIFIYNVDPI